MSYTRAIEQITTLNQECPNAKKFWEMRSFTLLFWAVGVVRLGYPKLKVLRNYLQLYNAVHVNKNKMLKVELTL